MRNLAPSTIIRMRRRRTTTFQRNLINRTRRLSLGAGSIAALALAVALLIGGAAYADFSSDLPSLQTLPILLDGDEAQLLQPTRLYDRTGEHILLTLENPGSERHFLSIDPDADNGFAPLLIQTTLAILQPDFWQSPGTDWENLTVSEPVTIAERLVMDLLLFQDDPGLRRTLRMHLLAAQLTTEFGRDQVLEWYLNSANYGQMAYGADQAARLYFGHSVNTLTLAEAALLVATSQAPALNPLDTPELARAGQEQVLAELLAEGLISQLDHDGALAVEWNLQAAPEEPTTSAHAFTNLVLMQLEPLYTRERLERGGLEITTTLDHDLQQQLACTVQTQLARLENQPEPVAVDGFICLAARLLPTLPPVTEPLPAETLASAVLLDPQTGEVLAMLGDTTLQAETASLSGHEPGTLLTPFVAVAAFARGMSPASLVWDIPATLPASLVELVDAETTYHGPVRLRTALANDYLAPVAGLMEQISPIVIWQLAAPMGLNEITRSAGSADLLYQGGQVTILEAAQGFGVFSSLGRRTGQDLQGDGIIDPVVVHTIADTAHAIWMSGEAVNTQSVVSTDLAYLVHHVLADSAARQPSQGVSSPLDIGRPSGAKLGQVADGRSLWAVGYTPQRVAAIWMGIPSGSGEGMQLEPRTAAGIEHAMLQYASRELPILDWEQPETITETRVCDPSGLLPTDHCPNVVTEVFITGSGPITPDTLFRPLQINRETGRLATIFTPLALVEEQVFLNLPAAAHSWAEEAGIPLAPDQYDDIQVPPENPEVVITSPELFATVRGTITLRGSAMGEGFTAYRLQAGEGLNPRGWVQIGADVTEAVTEGVLGTWDTNGLDGLYGIRLLVLREEGIFDSTILQLTVDNTPPLAEVLYPSPAETLSPPATGLITLQAGAVDAIGISRVEWWMDNALAGSRESSPFSLPWQASAGEHTLVVRVYDLAGNRAESDAVSFTVR